MSTGELISDTLAALAITPVDRDKLAVVCDDGQQVTYGELADRAVLLAGALRAQGIGEGGVVAILHENGPAYLEVAWACRLAAIYLVTLNTNLGTDEIDYILGDSGAQAVVVSSSLAERLGSNAVARLDREKLLAEGRPFVRDTELEGDLLQYSSGTTGRPKGIKRPLGPAPKSAAEDMKTFLLALIGATGESTYLCPAPLYHTAPFMWTMSMLRMGATVVVLKKFDPVKALEAIATHRVTHGQFVPTMFARMLKLPEAERLSYDVSSLQGVVHAAAPCPQQVKRDMISWWGPIVAEYWSSSEGAGFTFATAEEWLAHPGTVGKPLFGALHICDPVGNELPVGEVGQIWAEGIEFSYLNDAEKDASTTSKQGWRSVGDIGRFDSDGYLYLTDRANFMIITGGVNIYPQEAENRLIEHPRVYDAAVVGLPDDELGEIAVGVVQLIDPAEAGDAMAESLKVWCEEAMARYKTPRRIQFTAQLPRSDTGKLYKRQVRDDLISNGEHA